MLETDKIHFLVLYDLKIHFKITILRINLFYIIFFNFFIFILSITLHITKSKSCQLKYSHQADSTCLKQHGPVNYMLHEEEGVPIQEWGVTLLRI